MPDAKTARDLATWLVGEKLAACANIIPTMESVYEWDGHIEITSESILIVKTTTSIASATRDHIINHHPYETPCVLAIPVNGTHSSNKFMQWISQSTAKPDKS